MRKRIMEKSPYPTSQDAEYFTHNDVEYEFFTTADGSPSLRRESAEQSAEAMHHSGGALTESLFIYGDPLLYGMKRQWSARVMSVGLGLGYNELITAANVGEIETLVSFENDPLLRTTFVKWLVGTDTTDLPLIEQKLFARYEKIESLVSKKTGKDGLRLKLQCAFKNGAFRIENDVRDFLNVEKPFQFILFDAFSKKATPTIWTEVFVFSFLKHYAGDPCLFTTYSVTGTVNRALKAAGFINQERTGFQGKRQSTLAIRDGKGNV